MQLSKFIAGIAGVAFFGMIASGQASTLKNSDKKFLDVAATVDMTEAHVGKIAQNQAAESSVKDFGQKLVRDHTEAYDSLAALAAKEGATVPKGIDIRRNRSVAVLAGLKGRKFDQRFLTQEVQDQKKALVEFRREAKLGHDNDVKAYASKMIPKLEEHLRTAERLVKSERHRS